MNKPDYDYYSVDASVLFKLKDMPRDIFAVVWEEIERLMTIGRCKVFRTVAEEFRDDNIQQWLKRQGGFSDWDNNLNNYMNAMMLELNQQGLALVRISSIKNGGDPYVIAMALAIEMRNLKNLKMATGSTTCCVLTEEKQKPGRVDIPLVCQYYGLRNMNIIDFVRHKGWKLGK